MIPLITLLKEVNAVFPVHVKTPTFVCKVHEDNQSCITRTHNGMTSNSSDGNEKVAAGWTSAEEEDESSLVTEQID